MPNSLLDLIRTQNLDSASAVAAAIALFLVLLLSTLFILRNKKSSSAASRVTDNNKKNKRDKKNESSKIRSRVAQSPPVPSSTPAVDVWAERIAKGVAPASLNHKGGAGEAKPFGSSYYYAHNDSKTTGGYKDGLRMEDYTMNGPRLLSRNGSRVLEDEIPVVGTSTILDSSEQASIITDKPTEPPQQLQAVSKSSRRVLLIEKYLWDDTESIGTIRIDHLPTTTSGEMQAWKDVTVTDFRSELTVKKDMGLLVTVSTDQDLDYHLHIRKLFAAVVDVKTTVSKGNKRLLIKLSKERRQYWPHPHAKMT